MALKEQPIAIKTLTDRLFFTFEALAQQFDIELKLDYNAPEDLTLRLDLQKVEKVVNNLVHNAIKFTPRGGSVTLAVTEAGQHIEFLVADTGRGISEQDIGRVFERYYQTQDDNAASEGGTGIGLAIVREFAELHGGHASVSSVLGEGSTFVVALPNSRIVGAESATEPDYAPVKLELPTFPILEGRSIRILVVEDNKEMQHYLSEILSDYAEVIVASDGLEGLAQLETNRVDLMTIDVMMPNMNGFEFLERVKADERYATLPTVMLTARTSESDKLNALTLGVNDYLTKPFSQQELFVRVANLLANKIVREEAQREIVEEAETAPSVQESFINQLRDLVNQHLDDSTYSVANLATEIGLSERQLVRNVKKATGLTPLKFIREVKLLYAHDQLRANALDSVAAAAYAIGIENPSYFTKLFTERFGKNPSAYFA